MAQGAARTEPAVAQGEGQLRFEEALRRVEEHLASHPGDVRGWDVVAPIYLRVGRFADASRAYERARETGGASAARLLGEIEARIGLSKGQVPSEAQPLLASVLELEPRSVPARYYLALAQEQAGDRAGARTAYRDLLASDTDNASWSPLVRSRLARLDGASEPVPTLAASAITPDINAMVGGLDDRLRTSGGSADEWLRLIRSMAVLGRREDAGDRLSKAKAALASDPDGAKRLDRLAIDLGLSPR
jgi:cytochrome c-type biogenesis protein CcmH